MCTEIDLSLSLYVFIFLSRLRFMHNAPTNVDIIARDATPFSALYTHSSYVHLWICWCGKCGESMDRIPLEKSEGCLLLNLWLEGRTTYRLGFCGLCVFLCHPGRACVASNLQLGIWAGLKVWIMLTQIFWKWLRLPMVFKLNIW